jgi:hypothetical protein
MKIEFNRSQIAKDLAGFQEYDENGNVLLDEKGKPQFRRFKISNLIAA